METMQNTTKAVFTRLLTTYKHHGLSGESFHQLCRLCRLYKIDLHVALKAVK